MISSGEDEEQTARVIEIAMGGEAVATTLQLLDLSDFELTHWAIGVDRTIFCESANWSPLEGLASGGFQ